MKRLNGFVMLSIKHMLVKPKLKKKKKKKRHDNSIVITMRGNLNLEYHRHIKRCQPIKLQGF